MTLPLSQIKREYNHPENALYVTSVTKNGQTFVTLSGRTPVLEKMSQLMQEKNPFALTKESAQLLFKAIHLVQAEDERSYVPLNLFTKVFESVEVPAHEIPTIRVGLSTNIFDEKTISKLLHSHKSFEDALTLAFHYYTLNLKIETHHWIDQAKSILIGYPVKPHASSFKKFEELCQNFWESNIPLEEKMQRLTLSMKEFWKLSKAQAHL